MNHKQYIDIRSFYVAEVIVFDLGQEWRFVLDSEKVIQ